MGRVRETGVEVAHDARRQKTLADTPPGAPAGSPLALAARTPRALC